MEIMLFIGMGFAMFCVGILALVVAVKIWRS